MNRRLSESDKTRFFGKVNKTDTCWNWTGSKRVGYGAFWYKGKVSAAHRFSYEHFVGHIPNDRVLDHLCRNTGCVNPEHLRLVTHRENIMCGNSHVVGYAKQTHCLKGHEFNKENTYFYHNKYGVGRKCRKCGASAQRDYYARRRPQ